MRLNNKTETNSFLNIIKKEKGAVTLYVVASVVFLIVILASSLVFLNNKKANTQNEQEKIIKNYENINASELYAKVSIPLGDTNTENESNNENVEGLKTLSSNNDELNISNENISNISDFRIIGNSKNVTYAQYSDDNMPNGYIQLEYIQSTGNQYINTGYIPKTETEIYLKFSYDKLDGNWVSCMGRRTSGSSSDRFYISASNGSSSAGFGSKETSLGSELAQVNTLYEVVMNKDNITINNGTPKAFTSNQLPSMETLPIYLFARDNNGSVGNYFKGKIYQFIIKENGNIIKNFIPCINPSGKVGLYDTKGKVFYESSNSNKFLAPNNDVGDFNQSTGKFELKVCTTGKNKADYLNVDNLYLEGYTYEKINNGYILDYKNSSAGTSARISLIPCKLKSGKVYSISYNVENVGSPSKGISSYFPITPTEYFGNTITSGAYNWTLNNPLSIDRNYLGIYAQNPSDGENVSGVSIKITNVQVEEGNSVTEYEPYSKTTYTINLNQPLRRINDNVYDYIDLVQQKIYRKVKIQNGVLTELQTPIEESISIPNIIFSGAYYLDVDTNVAPRGISLSYYSN